MTHEQNAYWLAGLFDGEGCVATYAQSRRLFIANTDPTIIRKATEALSILGIGYRVAAVPPRQPHHKPQWIINITGQENLILFYNWVPFQSAVKVRRLFDAIASYRKPHAHLRVFTTPEGADID